jgi:LuxR family transcriptional regulator, quorum-sensing system regulator BjaR1
MLQLGRVRLQMTESLLELRAFDFIDKVNRLGDAESALGLLASELKLFGFEQFIITDMPPPTTKKFDSHLILNGWSPEWFSRYTRETTTPFFWDEIDLSRSPKASLQVMQEAREFNLNCGFSIPIFGVEGDQSCVTMGGRRIEIPPRGREAIHLISIYAHDKARTLRRKEPKKPRGKPRLTPREREVLLWVALGKTDGEIGSILSVSPETSFAHVRNSCRKLGAVTRTQVVVKAMQQGEIEI